MGFTTAFGWTCNLIHIGNHGWEEETTSNMKQWTRTQVYDGLHRASVWTLLGITGYGLTLLGSYAFRYFTEIRPMQKELRRKQNEESITLEQIQGEKELQQKKSDSETLYS
ncbi:uncharacterized protein LOC106882302 [Octopus bimaculoides]|nr:uncharacterized protein LOC106882302 [Octopus bimaculoides]|eukprot:XP_014788415.1 PREDICTED: uncharacterized protein LOC106882302 [Octopus bimaculoides]